MIQPHFMFSDAVRITAIEAVLNEHGAVFDVDTLHKTVLNVPQYVARAILDALRKIDEAEREANA